MAFFPSHLMDYAMISDGLPHGRCRGAFISWGGAWDSWAFPWAYTLWGWQGLSISHGICHGVSHSMAYGMTNTFTGVVPWGGFSMYVEFLGLGD